MISQWGRGIFDGIRSKNRRTSEEGVGNVMRAANENLPEDVVEVIKNQSKLARIRVLVPKDRIMELRSIAIGMLKESFEEKKDFSNGSRCLKSPMVGWVHRFMGWRSSVRVLLGIEPKF